MRVEYTSIDSYSKPMAPTTNRTSLLIWILQGLAALVFLAAGGAKLIGAQQMVTMFEKVGMGQWFRYATGLLEVGGAIGLFVPGMGFYAAALLALVMAGAVISQVTVLAGSPIAPAIMLVLTGVIAYLRKP